jgi:hypothetical protein
MPEEGVHWELTERGRDRAERFDQGAAEEESGPAPFGSAGRQS